MIYLFIWVYFCNQEAQLTMKLYACSRLQIQFLNDCVWNNWRWWTVQKIIIKFIVTHQQQKHSDSPSCSYALFYVYFYTDMFLTCSWVTPLMFMIFIFSPPTNYHHSPIKQNTQQFISSIFTWMYTCIAPDSFLLKLCVEVCW